MIHLPNLSRLASKNSRAPSAIEASGAIDTRPEAEAISNSFNTFLANETAALKALKGTNEKAERLPLYFDWVMGDIIPYLQENILEFYDPLFERGTGDYKKLRNKIQEIADILPEPPRYGAYQNLDEDRKVAWDRYISLRTRVYKLVNRFTRVIMFPICTLCKL